MHVPFLPGQQFIQGAFKYSKKKAGDFNRHSDVVNEYDDIYDESNDEGRFESLASSSRTYLPFRAILLILHEIGHDDFNEILHLFGIENARVAKKIDETYYLKMENKVYWLHHEALFSGDYMGEALDIVRKYKNSDYQSIVLAKMFWNDEDESWYEDDSSDDIVENQYALEFVYNILRVLYKDTETTSDRVQLRKLRYDKLRRMLLNDGFKQNDKLMRMLKTFETSRSFESLKVFGNTYMT